MEKVTFETIIGSSFPLESIAEEDSNNCRTTYVSQPPLDEFVDALAAFFSGNQFFPDRPAVLTETNWTQVDVL